MSVTSHPAPTVIRHEHDLLFSAELRAHRLILDQPVRAGGQDAGPSPVELLGVALGSCVALYVQQFCAARNLPFEGSRVEVSQRNAAGEHRVGEFAVKVILGQELPSYYLGLLERVATSCPVHNTLSHGAAISLEIESRSAVGVA